MKWPQEQGGWYLLCWMVLRDGREVEYGTVTGSGVPGILAGLRGCLPPLLPRLDPAHVRAMADTAHGWSYETDATAAHTHRIPELSLWAPLPVSRPKGGPLAMSHRRRRRPLESCTWTAVLMVVSAVALVLLVHAVQRGRTA